MHGVNSFGLFLMIKAGVNINLSGILGSLKRDKKGRKRLWNTIRQLPDPTMAPRVVGQLFGFTVSTNL